MRKIGGIIKGSSSMLDGDVRERRRRRRQIKNAIDNVNDKISDSGKSNNACGSRPR